MKFTLTFFVSALLLSACSQTDLARLIEPRHHRPVVVQHRPVSRPMPVQQRQVIVYPKRPVVVAPKRKTQSCTYIMRDLSKPSSTVWCYPGRNN